MRLRKTIISIALAAVAMLAVGAPAQAAARWTFMVYLDADNNLESAGIDDFLEMADVGSDSEINIIVQFDRISGYATGYDDWTSCKRFRITPGMTPTAASALSDIGEANMGDPDTLRDFIDWAVSNYPADNYALILWNHGGGWRDRWETLMDDLAKAKDEAGIREGLESEDPVETKEFYRAVCWDDTNGGDALYTSEVETALTGASTDVDLIGFDACLMAMIEVAFELSDAGPTVMVGSEETEPGDGWPYNDLLADLAAAPTMTPADLGRAIVDRYYQSYGARNTQSALDLGDLSALASAVDSLADNMSREYNGDLDAVRNAAQAVMDRIDLTVIHNQNGPSYPGAYGISIYFPDDGPASAYGSANIDFAGATRWDEFLSDFNASMDGTWIDRARAVSQDFYYPEYIDLYDFCRNLVNSGGSTPTPSPNASYSVSEANFDFEDISPSGTNLGMSDDSYANISIPFTFYFFGQPYNSVSIGSNGVVYFALQYLGLNNTAIPAANPYDVHTYIALFWDDLDPGSGGGVYYEVKGAAPDRRLIVMWEETPRYGTSGGGSFEVILYETTNEITMQWRDVDFGSSAYDFGASATVGLQENSASGLQYSFNSPVLENGSALLFTPIEGAASSILPWLNLLLD